MSVAVIAADTYPRQPDVDAIHYTFRLELGDASPEIKGEATVEMRFVKAGVAAFELDLASASNGKGMTVTAVSSSAGAVTYTHQANRVRIAMASPPKADEHRDFTIAYHGAPANGLRLLSSTLGS